MIRRKTNLKPPPPDKPVIRGIEDLDVMEIANRLRADKDTNAVEVVLEEAGLSPQFCKLCKEEGLSDFPRAPAMVFLLLRGLQTSRRDACVELLMSGLPLDEDVNVRKLLVYERLVSGLSEAQRNRLARDRQTSTFERIKAEFMNSGKSAGEAEEIAAGELGEAADTLRKRVERRRAQRRREAAAFRAKKTELVRLGNSASEAEVTAAAVVWNVSVGAARWWVERAGLRWWLERAGALPHEMGK
jgi:hypothetical protein